MDGLLEGLREKLMTYPDARVVSDDGSLGLIPAHPDGFPVRLKLRRGPQGPLFEVAFAGASEVVGSKPAAARLQFFFGLSTLCRLREFSRGGTAYRWIVEIWVPESARWEADWDDFRWSWALFKFWERPQIRFLQNRYIDLGSPPSPTIA